MIGNIAIKVMADGGQGFFKICLTTMPENESKESEFIYDSNDEEKDSNPIKKRKLYAEGGSSGVKAKLTSVQRLIMLCIVPQIKETYENIRILFELTKLNNISFRFVSDFKLLLIVNGQQTATATYPCPYCFVSLKELRDKKLQIDITSNDQEIKSNDDHSGIKDQFSSLKTYGDLKRSYEKYCLLGKNKNKAKECYSTVNLPLFEENDEVYVIQKCVIPELHILQGFVNHLFWDGLVPLLGREKAMLWPQSIGAVAENYHGEVFEGNACRKLLKNAGQLLAEEIVEEVGKLSLIPYVSALNAMNKVVNGCFSAENGGDELDHNIKELDKMFSALESVTETLKMHVTLKHLKHCLHFLDTEGLGPWSEQAGESVHHEFAIFWERYKINYIDDPKYGSRLKKAVVEFSSRHL